MTSKDRLEKIVKMYNEICGYEELKITYRPRGGVKMEYFNRKGQVYSSFNKTITAATSHIKRPSW